MAKKEEPKTSVWVFWIMLAIIGVSLLYAGIQSSLFGGSIPLAVMLIVVGIILLFIGLSMMLGKANIIANDIELPGAKKDKDKSDK